MSTRVRHGLVAALWGALLGYVLSRCGFTDYGASHDMLALHDFRLIFVFASAVVLLAVSYALFARRRPSPPRPIHRGSIAGGVLFGAGWALTGSCPGAAIAQLGEGHLPALFSIAGIVVGALAYRPIHARFFRWDRGGCDVE